MMNIKMIFMDLKIVELNYKKKKNWIFFLPFFFVLVKEKNNNISLYLYALLYYQYFIRL